jgi:hypothetical protein
MKYLITESQFDRIVFKYLDNQDFIQINFDEKIYFVNSVNDVYAQIKYNKNDSWCYVYYKLIEEISSFFSMSHYDSEKVIGRWVENTLQMKVRDTSFITNVSLRVMRIPYYN